jgi:hypothetical protein
MPDLIQRRRSELLSGAVVSTIKEGVWLKTVIGLFEPRKRQILFLKVKMSDFRLNEMSGDNWHYLQEPAVGYGSNALYVSMVIDDKLEVGHKRSKAVPARERIRVDQEAGKVPVRSDERIDFLGELLEVCFLKRTIRDDDKDISVAHQFKMNHRTTLRGGGTLLAQRTDSPKRVLFSALSK